MARKAALAILYFVSIGYVFLIVSPSVYCLQHGCKGPEGDAFMPAFFLTPVGVIAVALSLRHSIQKIRKRQSRSWLFWPLAIIFAIVLLAAVAFIVMLIYELATHRKS
jgi:hypothetical protein